LRADTGDTNAKIVAALPAEAEVCRETMTCQRAPLREGARENLDGLRLETGWIDIAQQKGSLFIHTSNPSLFAPAEETAGPTGADVWKEVEPELRPAAIDNPAMRYGVWWHEFVQQIPWHADPAVWDQIFEATRADSLDKARSAREWRALRQQISGLSDLPTRFANGAPIVHAEMPFFWRLNDRQCLEGVVDLALFESAEKKWFILDWKTNEITPDKIDKLRVHYRPQIAAYWKAVTEMTGAPVDAGIYSTSTGGFLLYDRDELGDEWGRLRGLQEPDFAAQIGRISG
jgi:hypothetical protein